MKRDPHQEPEHDWESCAKCIKQAQDDGILGPDAKPFEPRCPVCGVTGHLPGCPET